MTSHMMKVAAMVLVLAGSVGSADAAGPPAPAEAKDIARLVGNWKGTGSMTMGADRADGVKISWKCRAISGRWGVACDGEMTGIPGMDRYQETDLFGYDPGAAKLHWFSVTNAGETHDHLGGHWNGASSQFVYTGVQDGKPFKEVIDVTFKDKSATTLDLHAETFVDGTLASVLQATVRK